MAPPGWVLGTVRATVLLDTDVLSFLLKRDSRAGLYQPHLLGKIPAVSFMTVAEIYQWMLVSQWGEARRAEVETRLRHYVVIPYDKRLSYLWAEVSVQRRRKGRPISCNDAWIAATALRFGMPLITHNGSDYEDIAGLAVITEAEAR